MQLPQLTISDKKHEYSVGQFKPKPSYHVTYIGVITTEPTRNNFPYIPEYSRIFQNFPENSRIFPNILKCSNLILSTYNMYTYFGKTYIIL